MLKRKELSDKIVFFNEVFFPILKACGLTKSIMKDLHWIATNYFPCYKIFFSLFDRFINLIRLCYFEDFASFMLFATTIT
jgi:hypothetical protein